MCEDWARKKWVDADAQGNAAMDIGEVDGINEKPSTKHISWKVEGYLDEEGI